jgi:hypothetical protein
MPPSIVAYISGSYLAARLIVSGIASVAAAVLLRRLVQLDYDSSVPLRSVCGSFLFFRQLTFCAWDIAKACFSLWHSLLSWLRAAIDRD